MLQNPISYQRIFVSGERYGDKSNFENRTGWNCTQSERTISKFAGSYFLIPAIFQGLLNLLGRLNRKSSKLLHTVGAEAQNCS